MKAIIETALCLIVFMSYMIPTILASKKNDLRYLALYAVSIAVTIWCMAVMSVT